LTLQERDTNVSAGLSGGWTQADEYIDEHELQVCSVPYAVRVAAIGDDHADTPFHRTNTSPIVISLNVVCAVVLPLEMLYSLLVYVSVTGITDPSSTRSCRPLKR
jgi:hypothetical protein